MTALYFISNTDPKTHIFVDVEGDTYYWLSVDNKTPKYHSPISLYIPSRKQYIDVLYSAKEHGPFQSFFRLKSNSINFVCIKDNQTVLHSRNLGDISFWRRDMKRLKEKHPCN